MKIAVDARPALWSESGIRTMVRHFLTHIATADSQNEYHYYFDRDPSAVLDPASLGTFRYSNIVRRDLWTHGYMAKQLIRGRYDVYLTFLERDVPLLKGGASAIVTICDVIPAIFPYQYFRSIVHRAHYFLSLGFAIIRSSRIITISQCSRHDLLSTFYVAPSKIDIVTLGVDRGEPSLVTKRPERIAGKYILALGSTEPRKNNESLIDAFNSVRARIPDVKLVIAGSAWRGRVFPDAKLSDQIILTGHVTAVELEALYSHASLFCFLSLYEGFGLPILEAMAAGTPVIAAATSSLPEVAGDAALYVDPTDIAGVSSAIMNLLHDRDLRASLVKKGTRRAAEFTWLRTCEQIVAVVKASRIKNEKFADRY